MQRELILNRMAGLAWGWQGPNKISDDPEQWEIRIEELPDFLVVAESRDAVLTELLPALKTFLGTFVDNNELLPLPDPDQWWPISIEVRSGPGMATAQTQQAQVVSSRVEPTPAAA